MLHLDQSGTSHENGVAEQPHYRLKGAIDQVLMLLGNRDVDSTTENQSNFVRQAAARHDRLVQGKLEQEILAWDPSPRAGPVAA